jgi:hypothetical protein
MTSYFDDHLIPLLLDINPKVTHSYINECLGGNPNLISDQSVRIQFGIRMEKFFNKVISDVTNNLVHDNQTVTIDGITHQVDHVFMTKEGVVCYLECKCNLNLDSEKSRGSNEKVKALAEHFGVMPYYFVPVCRVPYEKDVKRYANKNISVVGVEWLASQIDLPFTVDEYFDFMKEVVGPMMEDKGMNLGLDGN